MQLDNELDFYFKPLDRHSYIDALRQMALADRRTVNLLRRSGRHRRRRRAPVGRLAVDEFLPYRIRPAL
jgi:hypothetical protein